MMVNENIKLKEVNYVSSICNRIRTKHALRRYQILDTPPDSSFNRITALASRLLNITISGNRGNAYDLKRAGRIQSSALPTFDIFRKLFGLIA
jgi:hypothetical protein